MILALLIETYSLKKGIEWYHQKYPYNDAMVPLKSLTYFEMAEEQTSPVLLNSKSWPECKKIMIEAVKRIVEET